MMLPHGVPDEQAAIALGEALGEYERDHSVEVRAVAGELVETKVMDADLKRLVESPRSLADLRSAASWMHDAAERLKAEPPDPTGVDSVVLLRDAYKAGTKLRQSNIWGEGAATTPDEADAACQRAWDKVLRWSSETYLMLLDRYPGPYERAFFCDDGEGDYQLGVLGLHMRLDADRRRGIDSGSWMDARLAVLSDMLRAYDR
jgi:hypothetical protein